MRALAAVLILAALAGCSNREHSNPFDPRNPETGGRPAGFVALAGDQTITLRWSGAGGPDLVGYQLARAVGSDTAFRLISDVLPPNTTTYQDYGLLNGLDHHYRLYFVFRSGPGSRPAEDVATPGPLSPWVTDYGAGTLARLTADGRHVAEVITPVPGGSPAAIDVDIPAGAVWACDPNSGAVAVVRPALQSLSVYRNGFSAPVAVAVDSLSHTAWIGDQDFNRVQQVTLAGTPASGGIVAQAPIGLALDPGDQALWICERTGNRVRYVGSATNWFVDAAAPTHVAVDSVTHEGWVTSFTTGHVLVLDAASGARLDSLTGFEGPIGIAVDSRRGRVWICDPNADQVIAVHRDGSEEFRVGGLSGPHEIAVDLATGEAWVTLGLGGQVARLTPTGAVKTLLGGFSEPWGIAFDIPRQRGPVPLTSAR